MAASEDDLRKRLHESGTIIAAVAHKTLAIPYGDLSRDAIEQLLLSINTRTVEIEELCHAISKSPLSLEEKRLAYKIEKLWRDVSRLVSQKTKLLSDETRI